MSWVTLSFVETAYNSNNVGDKQILLRKKKYFESISSIEYRRLCLDSFPTKFGPWGFLVSQIKGLTLWQTQIDYEKAKNLVPPSASSVQIREWSWVTHTKTSVSPSQRASVNPVLSGIRKSSKISHYVIQIFLSGHWNTLLLATRLHSSTLFAAA